MLTLSRSAGPAKPNSIFSFLSQADQNIWHGPNGLFCWATTESILTGYIAAWYGNCTTLNRKAIQRVLRTTQWICGCELPAFQIIYKRQCKAQKSERPKVSSETKTNVWPAAFWQAVPQPQGSDQQALVQFLSPGHPTLKWMNNLHSHICTYTHRTYTHRTCTHNMHASSLLVETAHHTDLCTFLALSHIWSCTVCIDLLYLLVLLVLFLFSSICIRCFGRRPSQRILLLVLV